MNVVEQIKDKGYVSRGWLGVVIQDVTRELAESFGLSKPRGALVSRVVAGSPAEKAGFEAGDVILKFDDRNVDASSDLPPIVGRTEIGKKSKAEIIRNNKKMTISVTVEELPEDEQIASGSGPKISQFYDNRLAMEVTDLSAEQRAELGPNQSGVTVRKIESGPAVEAGIAPGDIILSINNEKITDAKQFIELAKKLPTNKAIPVLVQRSGASQFLALKIPE